LSSGNLSGTRLRKTHGEWTSEQAKLVAPEAGVRKVDYNTNATTGYALASGLNVINNSYGIPADPSYGFADLNPLEQSTITHAQNGRAVVVMAAGNDGKPMGTVIGGDVDIFARELVGKPGTIFVGALDKNGSPDAKANLADYSMSAGNNAQVQSQFLVVGVDAAKTGLSGTSFAAPIVSGYAAIMGSKFTSATPAQITNQLLNTARTDTIQGYAPSVHGKGEASLSRALAPAALQ
jgi:subtilisin family serine protease